mmetsp:Transcript_3223/g.12915  ORF Transcript_3223/g.12915 Transcript_3223/m.12915 type:complete len:94 (+) Transcript_3223:1462-1743(+)
MDVADAVVAPAKGNAPRLRASASADSRRKAAHALYRHIGNAVVPQMITAIGAELVTLLEEASRREEEEEKKRKGKDKQKEKEANAAAASNKGT